MKSSDTARSWPEFLSTMSCASAGAVEEVLVEYVDFDIDSASAIVENMGAKIYVELGSSKMTFVTGNHLKFPFTGVQFWAMIDGLNEANSDLIERTDLPKADDPDSTYQLTHALADFLDLTETELISTLGGGWISVDETVQRDMLGKSQWFAAGNPGLIVLGISRDTLTLSGGIFVPDMMSGPAHFEPRETYEFDLPITADLEAVAETVDGIVTRARRRMRLCHGCREYTQQSWSLPGDPQLCKSCMAVYFGTIID